MTRRSRKKTRVAKRSASLTGLTTLELLKASLTSLVLPVKQAEQTQRWYFDRFPRIKRWQDDLKDQVVKRRMVQNVFGHRCYFSDRIEGTIFNQAAALDPSVNSRVPYQPRLRRHRPRPPRSRHPPPGPRLP